MSSVPCPQGDGVCAIPDHALIVSEGRLEIRSRDEIESEYPDLDLEGPLEEVHNAEALRDAYRSIDDPEKLRSFLRSFATQDSGFAVANEESRALIEEFASTADTTVYVYCTPCKHIFKKALP